MKNEEAEKPRRIVIDSTTGLVVSEKEAAEKRKS
jgi:hypothetical protein